MSTIKAKDVRPRMLVVVDGHPRRVKSVHHNACAVYRESGEDVREEVMLVVEWNVADQVNFIDYRPDADIEVRADGGT